MKSEKLEGEFTFAAIMTRYGELIRPPKQLRIGYRCLIDDSSNPEFISATSSGGVEHDPTDLHRSSLEDAFKMHWNARRRFDDHGFEIVNDLAQRISNGVECVVSARSHWGLPRLFDAVNVSVTCRKESDPNPGLNLSFETLDGFLDSLDREKVVEG